MKNSVYI